MNITVKDLIENFTADDHYYLNIKSKREKLYLGYTERIPEDLLPLKILSVYIDWVNEALGLEVEYNGEEV